MIQTLQLNITVSESIPICNSEPSVSTGHEWPHRENYSSDISAMHCCMDTSPFSFILYDPGIMRSIMASATAPPSSWLCQPDTSNWEQKIVAACPHNDALEVPEASFAGACRFELAKFIENKQLDFLVSFHEIKLFFLSFSLDVLGKEIG